MQAYTIVRGQIKGTAWANIPCSCNRREYITESGVYISTAREYIAESGVYISTPREYIAESGVYILTAGSVLLSQGCVYLAIHNCGTVMEWPPSPRYRRVIASTIV